MIIQKIENGLIYFDCSYAVAQRIGATKVKSGWKCILTRHLLKELNLLELHDKSTIKFEKTIQNKNLNDITGDERLRPYQRVDVNFLKTLTHKAIFNEMRTRKDPDDSYYY